MDEASSLLKNLQLPTSYHNISPNPSLVDGMVNPVLSPVSVVDQVVNLVSSSVEPLTKVVDPVLMPNVPPRAHPLPQDLLFIRPKELSCSSTPLSEVLNTHKMPLMISLLQIGKSDLAILRVLKPQDRVSQILEPQ